MAAADGAALPARAQRPQCTDPNASFPVDFDNQQCEGLAGPLAGVASASACAAACCADDACDVWQFCAPGGCSGSAAPPNSCYTGKQNDCHSGPGWVSRGDIAPYTFHDAQGNPVVNTTRFPDMKGMTDTIHGLGLTAGWVRAQSIGPFLLCARARPASLIALHRPPFSSSMGTIAFATTTAPPRPALRVT